jgi:hypothetical protein
MKRQGRGIRAPVNEIKQPQKEMREKEETLEYHTERVNSRVVFWQTMMLMSSDQGNEAG